MTCVDYEEQDQYWLSHLTGRGYHLSDSAEYKIAIKEVIERMFSFKEMSHEDHRIVDRNLIFLAEEFGVELPELAQFVKQSLKGEVLNGK